MDTNKIKISGLVNDSIVDGPGLRLVIFAQGCLRNCPNCHNPQTHDPNLGYYITIAEVIEMIKKNPLLKGVTFSGGEPFMQAKVFTKLAIEIKKLNLDIYIYSGFYFDELVLNNEYLALLKKCDFLIDGPFIESQKTLDLKYRGSSNQNIIDLKKKLAHS